MMMTEQKLKEMLEYGMLTGEEQERILAEYKRVGTINHKNVEFLEVLKKNIRQDEKELANLESELDELLQERSKLAEKIHDRRMSLAKKRADKEKKAFHQAEKDYIKTLRTFSFDFESINRKSTELVKLARQKIEQKALEKTRQNLAKN